MNLNDEKKLQQSFKWQRSKYFEDYNEVVGYYQAMSCLEHKRGNNVLDLACGDGKLTSFIEKNFQRTVGVDASVRNIASARQRLPHVEFHESLIEEFETDERFGTILLLDVLEHVVDPAVVIKKAAGFLAEDGVLIIHVPNALAINRRMAVLMGTLTDCYELSPFDIEVAGHRRSFDIGLLATTINNAGLKTETTGGVFLKMLSSAQMDWFLKNGLWDQGGFGWGRVGGPNKDWKAEFCRACYQIGKERPEDCNIIYACATL